MLHINEVRECLKDTQSEIAAIPIETQIIIETLPADVLNAVGTMYIGSFLQDILNQFH